MPHERSVLLTMGLAWQQGPLAPGAVGKFLVPEPFPARLLYAEPLRRRMRVMFGGQSIAASDDVVLLHEPARYPVAYFPKESAQPGGLVAMDKRTSHRDLGETTWLEARGGDKSVPRGAWKHTALPPFARTLENRVAFAWRAMDGFYEEAQRIVRHAADFYHRIDIRQRARHLEVSGRDAQLVDTDRDCALRVRLRAPLVCAARGYQRQPAHPGSAPDVLPIQGNLQLLRHGRRPSGGWAYVQPYREVQPNRRVRVFRARQAESDDRRSASRPRARSARHPPRTRPQLDDRRGPAGGAPESVRPIGAST
jgi:uncharacterized protein (DUF427 family)